ncbi:hypothetical protein EDB80DRAFT_757801 [Ilyonectria destructans]|nr:hypothetical protein EDB80DRAFT_757801 [Ilyonectria destructans]
MTTSLYVTSATVSYGDSFRVSITEFRLLGNYITQQAETLYTELIYNWDPVINLAKIKNDITNTEKSFLFMLYSDNHLEDAHLALCERVCTTRRNSLSRGGNWNWKAVFWYLRKEEAMCNFLLLGMSSLEFTLRGIYVYNKLMVFVVRHHKAKASTNREFIVARFLPAPFGRPSGCFTTALKDAISKVWDKPVNLQLFRHLYIGITEKHVRKVHKPFNRGHRPLQRGTTYSLDGAFPTELQPQLLHLYEWASTRWHEFLQMPSKTALSNPNDTLHLSPAQHIQSPRNSSAARKTQSLTTLVIPLQYTAEPVESQHATQEYFATYVSPLCSYLSELSSQVIYRRSVSSSSPSPPKRRRFTREENLPIMPSTNNKDLESTPWSTGPLFGCLTEHSSLQAATERHATIHFLNGCIENRVEGLSLAYRLDNIHKTTEWWTSIRCEVCFIATGKQQLGHDMNTCRSDEGNRARSIHRWLESLTIPRSVRGQGTCSMCTHTFRPCGEIRIACRIDTADAGEDKATWVKKLRSKSNPNGHCEQKPVIRRVIAALCAYDSQFLGKLIAKMASDDDSADLSVEHHARAWFEKRVPFDDSWIPNLLFVFETLVLAFYYRQNRQAGLPPLEGFPHRPAGTLITSLETDSVGGWGSNKEVKRWKVIVDWWIGKCSFCAGRRLQGPSILHTLRECKKGGAKQLTERLGCILYQNWKAPRKIERDPLRWICQYSRFLLRDTIIGLFQCGREKLEEVVLDSVEQYCVGRGVEAAFDDNTVARYLTRSIAIQGVEGLEILRQIAALTKIIWYGI